MLAGYLYFFGEKSLIWCSSSKPPYSLLSELPRHQKYAGWLSSCGSVGRDTSLSLKLEHKKYAPLFPFMGEARSSVLSYNLTEICQHLSSIEGPLVPQANHLCSPPSLQAMDIQNYGSSIHMSTQMKQTDPLGSQNLELTFHSSLSSSRENLQPEQKYNSFGTIMGKKCCFIYFNVIILRSVCTYSCLENPIDGGAWWATVHSIAKSWTRLSDFTSPSSYVMKQFISAVILKVFCSIHILKSGQFIHSVMSGSL